MRHLAILTVIVLALAAGAARAVPVISFSGVPATIAPGSQFSFDVLLTGATDLNSYYIDVMLSGAGVAGTDYFFAAAAQAPTEYVFTPDDGNFLTAQPANDLLGLSDFLNAGSVSTVAGVNDRVATITVGTSAAFVGPLAISIDDTTLELFNTDFEPIPDAAFVELDSAQVNTSVIPVPATTALLVPAMLTLVRRRR